MKNYFIQPLTLIVCLIVLVSCQNQKKKEESQNTVFLEYIESLETIALPFHHNSFSELPNISSKFDESAFEQFKHVWTYKPVGLVYKNDDSYTTLETTIADNGFALFLMSYDHTGNKIDSLTVYEKSGIDIGYIAKEYVTIAEDRRIIVLDTVNTFQLNATGDDYDPNTLQVTSDRTTYYVNKFGRFQKEVTRLVENP